MKKHIALIAILIGAVVIIATVSTIFLLGGKDEGTENGVEDSDGDGISDNEDNDDDDDGFLDEWEQCLGTDAKDPNSKPLDTDGDGQPDGDLNNSQPWMDEDDDNDSWNDTIELQSGMDPLNYSSVPQDTDDDGLPDLIDVDDDNDGYLDSNDDFPLDQTEWVDTDADGIGNNADNDDDNDGFTDADELEEGTDPLNPLHHPDLTLPFNQTKVGSRKNIYESGGPWWGPHIVKIATHKNTTFTYVMDKDVVPWHATLYSKGDGEEWQEGASIRVGNPPNIFVDSQGFVHLIGYEPFTDDPDMRWDGRLFHIKFNHSNTISSPYTFEYITPDTREVDGALNTSGSLYYGAAIGEDDTILVAYQVSLTYPDPPHAIVTRIYDQITEEWSYEPVVTNLSSRFCYPFVAVSNEYLHVLAIEDEFDENLPPDSPWRFGIVKHFQRARSSDTWVESILINFSSHEIDGLWLRNMDLLVDSNGIVHVILRYNDENGSPYPYHYWKDETLNEWNSELAIDTSCFWLKLWERGDGQLFYVYSCWNEQIKLIPFGSNDSYVISNLSSPYDISPVPYIASPRSGTHLSSTLDLVIFSNMEEIEAVTISCDVSGT